MSKHHSFLLGDDDDDIEYNPNPEFTPQEVDGIEEALDGADEDEEPWEDAAEVVEPTPKVKKVHTVPVKPVYDLPEAAGEALEAERGKAVIVEVNGRQFASNQFKPGHKGRPKKTDDASMEVELARKMQRELNREADRSTKGSLAKMRGWARDYGVNRLQRIMENMDDDTFFKAFVYMAPYVLPKIAAVEFRKDDTAAGADGVESKPHTITIRDMRSPGTPSIEIK